MVKVTWACPENRVWSQTFTPGGWGHQKQTTSSGRRAPEVAVWTRDIYKHGVHNSFVIYKYTAVLQVFKFHKKEEGRGKGEKKTTQRTKQKGKKKDIKKKTETKQSQINNTTVSLQRRQRVDIFTHVCSMYINYRGGDARGRGVTCVFAPCHTQHPHSRAPPRTPPRVPHARTHIHTHRHACRAAGEGRRVSPVRVLLYVIIRGGTIKQAGVEGLPLLPSGEDAGDGAESHLLFLLFPFLVFKIL